MWRQGYISCMWNRAWFFTSIHREERISSNLFLFIFSSVQTKTRNIETLVTWLIARQTLTHTLKHSQTQLCIHMQAWTSTTALSQYTNAKGPIIILYSYTLVERFFILRFFFFPFTVDQNQKHRQKETT